MGQDDLAQRFNIMEIPPTDTIYAQPRGRVQPFVFDASVAAVFPDMIGRSVPGYATTLSLIGILATRFGQPGTTVYDLGCSLGAASFEAAEAEGDTPYKVVGIDTSASMLERARDLLNEHPPRRPLSFHQGDIREFPLQDASMAILNFTLQFVPRDDRSILIRKIADALVPGGALVLSEKIAFADPSQHEDMIVMHHAFKKANGYSDLEISQKRTALENTLIPETMEEHRTRLLNAGFSRVMPWFQCFNFCSMLAVKD